MFQKRTDLALEARELWQESAERTTRLMGVKATKTKRPAKALSPKPSDSKPSADGVVAIDKESILFKP